jgi:hypothetical protein
MAIRDWHGGRIALLWLLTLALGVAASFVFVGRWFSPENPFIDRNTSFIAAVRFPLLVTASGVLVWAVVCTWLWLGKGPQDDHRTESPHK